ncbi:unnamed protein product [Caenorhabditis auriculariae]|uniref:RNA helicase n=1 Tax=Caenorhabditis auriculariae TaxID=2777116 RepID=A0A8S1GVZ8_9PELO|nr:unnamed protein product [Caenorhabditis auriculariae]
MRPEARARPARAARPDAQAWEKRNIFKKKNRVHRVYRMPFGHREDEKPRQGFQTSGNVGFGAQQNASFNDNSGNSNDRRPPSHGNAGFGRPESGQSRPGGFSQPQNGFPSSGASRGYGAPQNNSAPWKNRSDDVRSENDRGTSRRSPPPPQQRYERRSPERNASDGRNSRQDTGFARNDNQSGRREMQYGRQGGQFNRQDDQHGRPEMEYGRQSGRPENRSQSDFDRPRGREGSYDRPRGNDSWNQGSRDRAPPLYQEPHRGPRRDERPNRSERSQSGERNGGGGYRDDRNFGRGGQQNRRFDNDSGRDSYQKPRQNDNYERSPPNDYYPRQDDNYRSQGPPRGDDYSGRGRGGGGRGGYSDTRRRYDERDSYDDRDNRRRGQWDDDDGPKNRTLPNNHGGFGYKGGNDNDGRSEQSWQKEPEEKKRAPQGWNPEEQAIETLFDDTARKAEELKLDEDQRLEVKNTDIMDTIASWVNSGLDPLVLRNVKRCNYDYVRPIQAAVIPQVLAGYDVIGQAETGGGKTASFALPILHKLLQLPKSELETRNKSSPLVLVIAPTRELAKQLYENFRLYSHDTGIEVKLSYGEMSRWKNLEDIGRGCHVLIGTAGRLMDYVKTGSISLGKMRFFVLDEADKMLENMHKGTDEHLAQIVEDSNYEKMMQQKDRHQTLLFSATFPDKVESAIRRLMRPGPINNEPVRIVLAKGKLNPRIKLTFVKVNGLREKTENLERIFEGLKKEEIPKTLIFVQKKASTDFITASVNVSERIAEAISGDFAQDMREDIYNKFKKNEFRVLVGTDLCSRGLDIKDLDRVINVDLPGEDVDRAIDTFIHRVGRTARLHKGEAISFVDVRKPEDIRLCPGFVELLKETNQEAPGWLQDLARSSGGSSFGSGGFNSGFNSGFGVSKSSAPVTYGDGVKGSFGLDFGAGEDSHDEIEEDKSQASSSSAVKPKVSDAPTTTFGKSGFTGFKKNDQEKEETKNEKDDDDEDCSWGSIDVGMALRPTAAAILIAQADHFAAAPHTAHASSLSFQITQFMQKWAVGNHRTQENEENFAGVTVIAGDHRDRVAYNVVDEQKEYEDPDYFYGDLVRSRTSADRIVKTPPPLPPPMKPTHIAIRNPKKKSSVHWKVACLSVAVTLLVVFLITVVFSLFLFSTGPGFLQRQSYDLPLSTQSSQPSRRSDMEITPNHLLTLLITKRKVCIFEAGSGDEVQSRESFSADHIESAHLIFHSNLSHSGVPVHPLQFQRFARNQGVDNDCHVVIYDRGQMIWSTYAAWIFKLFGHRKVSLLAGGYLGWKTYQARSSQYKTEKGDVQKPLQGDFLASWNESLIVTYDDVLLNTEIDNFDVVDAQTKEEFLGIASGALYGHIHGARNLPIDAVYDWGLGQWKDSKQLETEFNNAALSPRKPVIVYCSTSLRSSMIWWALARSGYSAKIYFGGWPEWVVRAPDQLKVLGPTSS